MFPSALLVAAAALSTASAQLLSNGLNYSTEGPFQIATSQITPALLNTWCQAQRTNCPKICGSRAEPNTCEASTLEYTCTCVNGNTPNISDYTDTAPFYICEQWRINCVANHPDDLTGQADCQSVTCGSQNASAIEATSSSSPEATSSTASSSGGSNTATATPSGASASATPSSAAVAMHVAQNYGTGVLFAGLIAVFGLAL